MKRILFISYSNKNIDKVNLIKKELKGHPLFVPLVVADKREANKALMDKVTEGIDSSFCVIPILTKDSINEQWINQEIGYAHCKKRKILPIVEERIMNSLKGFIHKQKDLPYRYKTKVGLSMKDENKSFMYYLRLLITDLEEELSPKVAEKGIKTELTVKTTSIDPVSNAVKEHFPVPSILRKPIDTYTLSGNRCPESGVWRSITKPSRTITMSEGMIMPLLRTKRVKWQLISYT